MLRRQHETLLRYYRFLGEHVRRYPIQPTFSIVVPVFRPNPAHLREALASVALQIYDRWQVCITDDASADPEVTAVITEFAARHPGKVAVAVHETNQHISAASNTALAMATGDYVALLDHDDRLYPQALAETVRTVNNVVAATGEQPEILYSDERVVGPEGEHLHDTFFKPGWSPLLHASVNYTTHLSVYRRDLLEKIGGFRVGYEGAQDHDLMLRAVESATTEVVSMPYTLYQWRAHASSTASDGENKSYAWDNGMKAVAEALSRQGRPAVVTRDDFTGHYRMAFELPDPLPRISVVIPTRNGVDLLRTAVGSLLARTTYPDFELVIVDNGSDDPAAFDYYDELTSGGADVRIVSDPDYFNFARLINAGVDAAEGEILFLLNNDTEVLTPDWAEQMLMYAQFDDVGAVGAKLLYPDGRVQHGGVVGAAAYVADHSGQFSRPEDHRYIDMVNTVHEALAVTAAAMMMRREVFVAAGGFNELDAPNAFGDVDLCLRLRRAGLVNVYTPYAEFTHYESATRLRNVELEERFSLRKRWAQELLNDPYLNVNLDRSGHYMPDLLAVQPEIDSELFRRWLAEERIS